MLQEADMMCMLWDANVGMHVIRDSSDDAHIGNYNDNGEHETLIVTVTVE